MMELVVTVMIVIVIIIIILVVVGECDSWHAFYCMSIKINSCVGIAFEIGLGKF
jgi:hypothetical protein